MMPIVRRSMIAGALRLGALSLGGAAAARLFAGPAWADEGWHSVDIAGSAPPLAFTLTDATTGRIVTAHDFRGKLVMLTLGYTHCPDICPLTLGRVDEVLSALNDDADWVRVLFVTVDPSRDTLPVLKQYAAAFGPQVVGLRGTPDQIARLAQRYRLAYATSPATGSHAYEVTHPEAVYVFDGAGAARLLIPSLASESVDIDGTSDDLRHLMHGMPRAWWSRLISAL